MAAVSIVFCVFCAKNKIDPNALYLISCCLATVDKALATVSKVAQKSSFSVADISKICYSQLFTVFSILIFCKLAKLWSEKFSQKFSKIC